jgi:hypothetical protein
LKCCPKPISGRRDHPTPRLLTRIRFPFRPPPTDIVYLASGEGFASACFEAAAYGAEVAEARRKVSEQ